MNLVPGTDTIQNSVDAWHRYIISGNVILEVRTSRKKLYLRMDKKAPNATKEMREIRYNISKVTNTYNGNIIPMNAKFALIAFKEDWQQTAFIFPSGVMTEEIMGFNGIPEEALKDKESLISFLDSWFAQSGIRYNIDELNNYLK